MGVEGMEDGFGFVRATSGIAGSSLSLHPIRPGVTTKRV